MYTFLLKSKDRETKDDTNESDTNCPMAWRSPVQMFNWPVDFIIIITT